MDDPLLVLESGTALLDDGVVDPLSIFDGQDLADDDGVVDPLSILDGTLGKTQPSARLRKLPRTSATALQSEQLQASSATTSSAGANAALRGVEDAMTLALAQAPIFAKTAASAAARMCRQFAGVFSMLSLNTALAEQQASLQALLHRKAINLSRCYVAHLYCWRQSEHLTKVLSGEVPDVIAGQQSSKPDVVVISWSWDETHQMLSSRRGLRTHNLPLTEEYLRSIRAGLSTANVAMSIMVQAGGLLVADAQGRELVREPITVPLVSVDRLTAECLQTAMEKYMPVTAMTGHAGYIYILYI
jgi:hypothetical protein